MEKEGDRVSQYLDHNDYESVEEYEAALEECLDLADYLEYHKEDAEVRLQELDTQHEAEGGK